MPPSPFPARMKIVKPVQDGAAKGYTLVTAEAELAKPKEHEVTIKVHSAGVNRADIFQSQGTYAPPKGESDILGLEVAGEVIAIGSEVKTRKVGDKVCALLAGGGYAEYINVSEALALTVPQGLSMAEAASLPEAMFTAYLNLFEVGHIAPGKSLLIHGGASGVGVMAIQMASQIGAEIYTTAGSKEKCALCTSLGGKRAINYKTEDFLEVIKKETSGAGVDLVLDMVGGDYFQKNLNALSPRGILISIAFLQSNKAEVNFGPVLMKNLTIMGTTLRGRSLLEKHELARSLETVFWPMLEDKRIKPVIDTIVPFERADEAHERMFSNKNAGKLILQLVG